MTRQADDRRRGRRRAARRHDDRHRRLGLAAQADGAGPGDPALRRSRDLTIVTYGGPDVGLLCAAGQGPQARLRVRVARLDPARAALPRRPPGRRRSRSPSSTRACSSAGLHAAAQRLPFLPTRAGLGSDVLRVNPRPAHGHARRTTTARSWSPCPRCSLDAALVHLNRADAARQRASTSAPTPTSTTCSAMAADARATCRASGSSTPPSCRRRPVADAADQPARWSTASSRRPNGAHFTDLRARLRARRGVPARVRRSGGRPRGVGGVRASGSCPATRRPTRRPSRRGTRSETR